MTLIVLPASPSLLAQSNANPDSILILRDDQRNPKFIFPYEIAVEYRNLKMELYPLACERIGTLSQLVAGKEALVQNLEQQNNNLEQVVANQQVAVDTLRTTLVTCRNEVIRLDHKAKFYQIISIIATPVAVLAGLVAVLK